MFARLIRWFTRPAAWGLTALVSAIVALAGFGGFSVVLDATNTMGFCISCHEMEQTVYQEYTKTAHYQNPSGVRATCADCHVPKELGPKLVRKAMAANDVYHAILGDVGTPEKFEAKRLVLAKRVWAQMAARDSKECRNCHAFETMQIDKQRDNARKMHPQAIKEGETCITCHKGIAHKLPDMSGGYKLAYSELLEAAPQQTAKADTLYTLRQKAIFADRADAKAEAKGDGTILPATRLTVLERDGDWLKVRIDGWQQDGVKPIIYALAGKRIFQAALSKKAEDMPQVKRSIFDSDTDLTWHEVSFTGWVDKGQLVADEAKLWAYGGEMYNAACGTCHSLRAPTHFLANQWIGNLDSMKRFVSLDKEEYRFLQKYLQLHASDTGGQGAAH